MKIAKIIGLGIILGLLILARAIYAETLSSDQVGIFGLENKAEADDLGVGWTRLPLWWGTYEADLAKVERMLKNLDGVKIIATIRSVNSGKTNCPQWVNKLVEKRPNLSRQMSCPPKDMEEYKTFVRAAVRRLKGKIAAWQIENEIYATRKYWVEKDIGAIKEFIPLFKAASEIIREEDPGTPILAPGITLGGVEFDENAAPAYRKTKLKERVQKRLFEACESNMRLLFKELCGYFDVIDLHLYHTVESIPGRVNWLKKLMQEALCEKEIWSTEIAGPQLSNIREADAAFLAAQAKELPVRLQAAIDSGIEKVIYFHYRDGDPKTSPDIMYATLGLVGRNGRKKPAYFTMQEFMGVRTTKAK